MNRRQLLFVVLFNSIISLTIAIAVVWFAEQRRPDLEELAARYTPPPPVVLIATATPGGSTAVAATPTPSAPVQSVPTPLPAETGEPEIYVVETGDSLLQIALRYGLTMEQLMEANNLANPDFVFVGQRLVIPNFAANGGPAPTPVPPVLSGEGLELRFENPGDLAGERLLIINESDAAINLQGWSLSRSGGSVYTFDDLPLFPGGSVRLNSGSGDDDSLNRFWNLSEAQWTSGAVARLRNPDGEEIAEEAVP